MSFHPHLTSYSLGKAHKKLLKEVKGLFAHHPQPTSLVSHNSRSIKELQSGSNDNDSHVQMVGSRGVGS